MKKPTRPIDDHSKCDVFCAWLALLSPMWLVGLIATIANTGVIQ